LIKKQVDLYLIGKYNIIQTVLDLYDFGFEEARHLILDCGCGRGIYAHELDDESYVGLDVCARTVKLAHRINPNGTFVVGDATKLPFIDEIFDCIICSEVLEHITDDKAVLDELMRVLEFSSRLIISVPNLECKNFLIDWQRRLVDKEVGHCRMGYRFSALSRLLAESGFYVKKTEFGCGPVTAAMECVVILLGGIFGYQPSRLEKLFEESKSLLVRTCLRIYRLLFPIVILFTYFDKLLPRRYRSNIALLAEK
jgi:SAM-dependent methyltransferase